jgi:phosphoribosylamine---glycine ligase
VNVLLVGSGGREHALAVAIAKSAKLNTLWALPGNPGIAAVATCLPDNVNDVSAVVARCRSLSIDLVVIGPEAPLVAGLADALSAAGINVFGPSARAAEIEGSKAFAKSVMHAANVPTARFEVFDEVERAAERALSWGPVVVKADGLAAGKGVVVAASGEDAAEAVRALGRLPAGKRIVLEEVLAGPELSIIGLCDGERARLFPPAQDHKQLLDHDQGPNTGGMGVFAPAWPVDAAFYESMQRLIFEPTLRELDRLGRPFRGALFAGLMMTQEGPKVLEFNCRFGDPETQALLPLLDEDALSLLWRTATGRLEPIPLATKAGASVTVVLASHGYPQSPQLGAPISGADHRSLVFHSGTKIDNGRLLTAGGRVLSVGGVGASVEEARAAAYESVARISFDGMHFRKDIGGRRAR